MSRDASRSRHERDARAGTTDAAVAAADVDAGCGQGPEGVSLKATVCFGNVRVVVPCGDGDLPVSVLIERAVARYRKATGKQLAGWLVTVHNLRTCADNAILDPSDKVKDVIDDREQIIASFAERYDDGHPGVKRSATTTGTTGTGRRLYTATNRSGQTEAPASDGTKNSNSAVRQCGGPQTATPNCCCTTGHSAPISSESILSLLNNKGYDEIMVVSFSNVTGSLGIHVVPAVDCFGRNYGLTVHTIEQGGRVEADGRIHVNDVITSINETSLLNVDFNRAQEIFKVCLSSSTLRLVIMRSSRTMDTKCGNNVKCADTSRTVVSAAMKSQSNGFCLSLPTGNISNGTLMTEKADQTENVSAALHERPESTASSRVPSRVRFAAATNATNTRVIGNKFSVNLVKGVDGLGFSVTTRDNPTGGSCPIYIKKILPKGAAIESGCLEAGDRLLQVNETEVTGKTQGEVVALLRSLPMNETVHLIISRQLGVDDMTADFDVTKPFSVGTELQVEALDCQQSKQEQKVSDIKIITQTLQQDLPAQKSTNAKLKNEDTVVTDNRNTACDGDESHLEPDSSVTFNREGFGRQSMSEKRKAHLDPRCSEVYRRIRQTKDHYVTASLDRSKMIAGKCSEHGCVLTKAESAESILSRYSQALLASANEEPVSTEEVGAVLGLKKSTSLESLQTAVHDVVNVNVDERESPPSGFTRQGLGEGRGFNSSFRSAVDRSFNSNGDSSASDENTANNAIETVRKDLETHLPEDSKEPHSPSKPNENGKKVKREKSKTRFKGFTSIFRFGKSSKKTSDTESEYSGTKSQMSCKEISHPYPLSSGSATSTLPPPDVLSRALEKHHEFRRYRSNSREPSSHHTATFESDCQRENSPFKSGYMAREYFGVGDGAELVQNFKSDEEEQLVNSREPASFSVSYDTTDGQNHQRGQIHRHGRFSSVPAKTDDVPHPGHNSQPMHNHIAMPGNPYYCQCMQPVHEHMPWMGGVGAGGMSPAPGACSGQQWWAVPNTFYPNNQQLQPYWHGQGYGMPVRAPNHTLLRRVISHMASDSYVHIVQPSAAEFARPQPDYRSLQNRRLLSSRREQTIISSSALV